MAVRTVRVGPDSLLQARNGEQIAVVSRNAQIQAIADFVTVCDVCGGTFNVLFGRVPTGLPGEMATNEMMINWMDRGDAKSQYEETVHFEPQGGVVIGVDEEVETVPEPLAEDVPAAV